MSCCYRFKREDNNQGYVGSFAFYKPKPTKRKGNYNNEIGLPLIQFSICRMILRSWSWRWGRITWEIFILCLNWLIRKTAIVTLVGEAHLGLLSRPFWDCQGKLQIADGMEKGSLLLAPADPIVEDYLPTEQKVVRFGPVQNSKLQT